MTEVHLFDPQALYRHWEEEQWSPSRSTSAPTRSSGRSSEARTAA